jgi:Leucine Rich Repeat (LRR) protein
MRKLYILIFFFLNLNLSYAELPVDFNWRIYVDAMVNPDLAVEFSSLPDNDKEIQAKKHYETRGRDEGKVYQYTRAQKETIADNFLNGLELDDKERVWRELIDLNTLKLINKFIPNDENWSNLTKLLWLTELDLEDNELTSLPDTLGNLTALTSLNLSYNRLTSLPEWIGNFTFLSTLTLDGNKFKSLPDSIGNLTALTVLYLDTNQLESLPDSIGNLTALRAFYLRFNKLRSLPGTVRNLAKTMTLLNLEFDDDLVMAGEGDTLGQNELRAIFGDRVTLPRRSAASRSRYKR